MQGEHILLKVSPMKGVMRFGKKEKLNSRFIGPFEISQCVGPVAYELALPSDLSAVHPVFHVSMLKRYYPDDSHVIQWDSVNLNQNLTFEEEPITILDRQVVCLFLDVLRGVTLHHFELGYKFDDLRTLISVVPSLLASLEIRAAAFHGNETDKLALLGFKSQITEDPSRVFASWNESVHFCRWTGVKCGPRQERVIDMNLKGLNLAGSIGNFTSLEELYLTDNNLEGEVPASSAQLTKLRLLGFSVNSLSGEFPPSLYNLSSLELIALSFNNFSGNLRSDLGHYFPNLQRLYLANSQFIGSIPSSLSNASKLLQLDFPENNFTGNIP
ncbi:putative LRR receptor-like serine/threonine-protein kinase [Capsicum chinense]|nr:putative LRR receptor-like serine/threonine-protein kinase [Capsicum chinense]